MEAYAVGSAGTILFQPAGLDTWRPLESGTSATLISVWGSGPMDVYAGGGGGTLLHGRAGTPWHREIIPAGATIHGLWGSGPGDVFAAGELGGAALLLHGDGTGAWTSLSLPAGAPPLAGVWGSGPTDVYAVGGNVILHTTDGTTFTVELGGAPETLLGVGGSAATDVFAGGDRGLVLHRDGSGAWTVFASGVQTPLRSVTVLHTPFQYLVYAVGDGGVLLYTPGPLSCWYPNPTGTTATLNGVTALGSGIYAVGAGGAIVGITLCGG